jgi:hypothetical protein
MKRIGLTFVVLTAIVFLDPDLSRRPASQAY